MGQPDLSDDVGVELFLSRYPVQQVGGRTILELWVPAEELDGPSSLCQSPVAHSLSAALLPKFATSLSRGSSVYWWNRHETLMRGLPAVT